MLLSDCGFRCIIFRIVLMAAVLLLNIIWLLFQYALCFFPCTFFGMGFTDGKRIQSTIEIHHQQYQQRHQFRTWLLLRSQTFACFTHFFGILCIRFDFGKLHFRSG